MKLPMTIRIGALTYQVEPNCIIADGDHAFGQVWPLEQKIRLAITCLPAHLPSTLLHEIVHGIDIDRRINLTDEQVGTIANGLCAVLQDLGCWPVEFEQAE